METFTDSAGRAWTVTVTVSTIKQVRALTGVDLLKVVEGTVIDQLASDAVLLVDVLYAVCKDQTAAPQRARAIRRLPCCQKGHEDFSEITIAFYLSWL